MPFIKSVSSPVNVVIVKIVFSLSEVNVIVCPFVVKEDIVKTRMVEKEYAVTKEGTIKLNNGQEIYRTKGSTVKDTVAEQYVAGQKDVRYQGYVHRLEYTFKESGKVVTAEDGTKLLFEEARKRKI